MTFLPTYNIFDMALKQFERCATLLELDQPTRDFLKTPMREYHFSLPIFMDNGEPVILKSFMVQYNDARGPTKGGVRFHPSETIDTIRALAMWMTWKCAINNLPLGGSSSGVICDPHLFTSAEQERISRGFVRKIAHLSGPKWDVLGPDMMTTPQHMLWMLDEYENIHNKKSPGFITGKPIHHGGSKGRKEAPGYGAMVIVSEVLKDLGIELSKTRASFQGLGMVGQHAAHLYYQMGGTISSIACWNHIDRTAYTFFKKDGIDFDQLISITNQFGEVDKEKAISLGYECLPGDDWLSQDVDILVPAALENQIRQDNFERINPRVKVIIEAANGPIDLEIDSKLNERGIIVVPDILANSGGVICSYFEQVQGNMNYFWSKEEVLSKIATQITSAYIDVSNFAQTYQVSLRDSSYMLAIDRVARACHERSWI
jgi:glutamate dehydrogenase (NAD(P)+)